ncbi:hypothetical protein DXG01_006916 [Tephrocybe rancida]|nr:hypothetical protein DXG01_006916 [Tephrocybe rancida]
MKTLSWLLVPTVLSTSLALGKLAPSDVKRVTTLPTIPNKFIVEVDSLADIPSKRSLSPHEELYAALKKRRIGFEVNKEYNSHGLFVGAALTLTNSQDAAALLDTAGVKAIRPVRTFQRPAPIKVQVVKSPQDAGVPPDSQSTHILTGVDKLHAEGITGKGIKIGIVSDITTGIDYTHPALGGAFGPGNKVIGGYDLVGDDYDGSNDPVPDADPLDQCAGHGTHVAGIIGANPGNPFNISGVAYEASLSSYRVFGCLGFVSDDVIIEALLLGAKEGQNILSLSLGGTDGWTESSSSVVASRVAATGIIVTISAGNDGASGSWYSSSPGNGINVISVSSLDKSVAPTQMARSNQTTHHYLSTIIPLQNLTLGGVNHSPITYFETFPFPFTGAFPIYATSNDTAVVDDACNPLPDSTPDLSPYVVIVRRGTCTFVSGGPDLSNSLLHGWRSNGNGFAGIDVGDYPAALIQAADGEFLASQFAAGTPVTITFPQTGGSTNFPDAAGGLISSFTSYGPTNDFFFKPSIAAPGGNILSTLPTTQGSYGVESGTSMAAPFVAGSAALLLAAKGTSASVGKTARTLFETTAQRVPSSHTDGDPLQTVTQQGAGLIDVYKAIHTTTIVSPGELILNDTAHFEPLQYFTVRNTGKSSKKYKVSHVPAGTALTVQPGTIFPSLGPVPLSADAASVVFSEKSFTVAPGATHTVVAYFSLPDGDASTFPVFSGFIEVTSGTESLHVTYIGLAASLRDKQVVDDTDYFFGLPLPAVLDEFGNFQTDPTNYTFVGDSWPALLFRLTFGTPLLRVDLVASDIQFTATLATRALHGHPFFTFPHPTKKGTFAKVKTLGAILEYDYFYRNNEDEDNAYNLFSLETPTFADGTTIPNGSYRFLVRALKVTGDPTKEEDYESWLSPIVGVVV